MPASPWFESDGTQKAITALVCGFCLCGAVATAWAVSGAPLTTLWPSASASQGPSRPARPKATRVTLDQVRFGQIGIALRVPSNWQPIQGGPTYLTDLPHKVFQDPRRPSRWLAIAKLVHAPKTIPTSVTNVDLRSQIQIQGRGTFLLHLHDQAKSKARAVLLRRKYLPLFGTIVNTAKAIPISGQ